METNGVSHDKAADVKLGDAGTVKAADQAEFLGAALGFNLLLGIPLWVAGLMTAVITFLILGLERYGFRPLEAVITALVGVISVSYLIETVLDRPNWGQVLFHAIVPQFSGSIAPKVSSRSHLPLLLVPITQPEFR